MNQYIRCFSEIGLAGIPSVGGKNGSLGELEIVTEKKAQLVAAGTHRRHGLDRFALFSTSWEVILR